MKKRTPQDRVAVRLTALLAALAAFASTGQAQVTLNQVTNGLVAWYPLDKVETNGSSITTPDHLNGRDMLLSPAAGAGNVIASTRPSLNGASVSNCFNLNQVGGATVIYYNSTGQNPLTGGGDFLPFHNQINATMSFWIKCNDTTGRNDSRFFGECDTTGANAGPILLWGTSSGGGLDADKKAHFLFRQKNGAGDINAPDPLSDGTFEVPNLFNYWTQGGSFTSNNVLDGSWHLMTMTIDSNRVIDIYIDGGLRDLGPSSFTGGYNALDANGNPGYGPDVPLTNFFYTTNVYPAAGVSNPPPNGYVRWVWNSVFKTGSTVFGGFKRGGITGGFSMQVDDIGFWNRKLSVEEIEFVYTNGITDIPINRPLIINSFTADFAEVGQGDFVTLRWNITGALTNAGNIVISGVGDVGSKGLSGSTNVTLSANQTYLFTLTAQNGVVSSNASVTVKTFPGVSSDWHLIQRFDGVFSDTIDTAQGGVSGNGWVSSEGDFSGTFDKWNVFTITNSGAENKVMSPRTGYNPNISSASGFESRGALSFARLGSLTMAPGQSNTLFFRFSLQEPATHAPGVFSDLDFGVGLSDYGFLGPSAGLGFYGGTGGGLGPYFSILRSSSFVGGPLDLFAPDTADPASTNTAGQFSYTASVDPNGLMTNVNYLVWMDVWNRNTHAEPDGLGGTNTVEQAQYSVWLQRQGEPTRTLLFTNFHGNRNYVAFNPVNDDPTPFLDKVFFNIGSESFVNGAPGSYITTNMIAVDDIYISKSGYESTVPRLFDLTSIVRGSSSVTIQWNSLGSMFQTNTYVVQRKLALADPTWTNLGTVPSGGASTTYIDNTVGSSSTAFYRIIWP
jgi:hypothetical protein